VLHDAHSCERCREREGRGRRSKTQLYWQNWALAAPPAACALVAGVVMVICRQLAGQCGVCCPASATRIPATCRRPTAAVRPASAGAGARVVSTALCDPGLAPHCCGSPISATRGDSGHHSMIAQVGAPPFQGRCACCAARRGGAERERRQLPRRSAQWIGRDAQAPWTRANCTASSTPPVWPVW